jgi:RsiW-degrading membrane proteinase PrsW (M82 family)
MDIGTIINWLLALTPVLILVLAFLWLDVFHLLSWRAIAWLLVLGGTTALVSYPISGSALDALPIGFSNYSRFVAPWIEEALKGLVVVWLFVRNRIGYKIDAALSGMAIGAGFAIAENAIYLAQIPSISPGVWLVRGAGTAVMHSGAVAVMAALSHQTNEHELLIKAGDWKFHPFAFLPGLIAAAALHTAFNQFASQPLIAMVVTMISVPLMVILVFSFGAREAASLLKVERAEHLADQPALAAGTWPDRDSSRRLRALAGDRPELATLVLDYWRVLTEIVLNAESRMIERANGQWHDREADLDRARFAALAELEARFDRATLRSVKKLFPFSRNDLWDIAELREQLERD